MKNAELAKLAYGSNFEQVSSAPVTIACLQTQIWLNVLVDCPELAANNFLSCWLLPWKICQLNLPALNNRSVTPSSQTAGLVAAGSGSDRPGNQPQHYPWFKQIKSQRSLDIETRSAELLSTVGYLNEKTGTELPLASG